MTDIQGAHTAGILASGAAGVNTIGDPDVSAVEDDERANDAIIDQIAGPGPVPDDSAVEDDAANSE